MTSVFRIFVFVLAITTGLIGVAVWAKKAYSEPAEVLPVLRLGGNFELQDDAGRSRQLSARPIRAAQLWLYALPRCLPHDLGALSRGA